MRSAPPFPCDDGVDVWFGQCSAGEPGPLERFCQQWLDAGEQHRADRFRVASARNQHIVGRGMARWLLAGREHLPTDVAFRVLDHGKPIMAVPESSRRSFNVAHTSGLVLCGLGASADRDQWLGVDVEQLDRRTDSALADRYFAQEEIDQLDRTSSETERQFLFLKIWTLKEAFIKAIGTGLQTPLDQFAFVNAAADVPQLVLKDSSLSHQRCWHIESITPDVGFIAAVAIGNRRPVPDSQPVRLVVHRIEDHVIKPPNV
ncbi:MAG: 4'-phosphopantetheinyl transferase superfamily protein [Planctomycetota bacterium]